MSEDQECRMHPLLAIVLAALWLAPPAIDLLDDLGADGTGELAWEFAHGLPKWRRKFRQGWRRQAGTEQREV